MFKFNVVVAGFDVVLVLSFFFVDSLVDTNEVPIIEHIIPPPVKNIGAATPGSLKKYNPNVHDPIIEQTNDSKRSAPIIFKNKILN